jgi:phosphoribosylanthranilate isomerase
VFLKICGITRAIDARHAVEQGATALGFVFWPDSPRVVTLERAAAIIAGLPAGVTTVGVFVNEPIEGIRRAVGATGITMVQLHGDEPAAYADALDLPLLRAVTVGSLEAADLAWPSSTTLLLDAADPVRRGGTGTPVDWTRAAGAVRARRIVLAGGLTPGNVAEAVEWLRPYGVDVSSGVEEAPGVKDFEKVSQFLSNARRALAHAAGAGVRR